MVDCAALRGKEAPWLKIQMQKKTEPASGKRLEEARQKGQVPRSQELGSFAIMITGMLAMVALGPKLAIAIEQICRRELTFNHATVLIRNRCLSISWPPVSKRCLRFCRLQAPA